MRVRFAPSPTGVLHIGGARTALYNWLLARGSGGQFVLRIEDTDRERSTPENVEQILDALRWLELDWDEGPISQWERRDRHKEAVEQLLESGHAYEDEGAVRFRVPDEGEISFHDVVLGDVTNPHSAIKDFVIQRSDGSPLYNLAVAVDDRDMGITHVVRGQDHVSNTPRQLMILRALGEEPPVYAHIPLLHGPDGKKLSKRHGAASVQEVRDDGYLPEAVRNYIALLGWGYDETTDPHDHRRAGGALRARARLEEPRGLRRAEAALDERPLPARAAIGGPAPPAPGVLRPRRPPDRDRRDLRARRCRRWRTSGPLAGPLIEAPSEYEEKAWQSWGRSPHLSARARRPRERARMEARDDRGRRFARVVDELGVKPKEIFQPIRVAITGTTVSPGHLRIGCRPRPRGDSGTPRQGATESGFRAHINERPQPFVHPCRYPG